MRAAVRDPHGEKASALAERGVEIVPADLNSVESVRTVLTGASTGYAMTTFTAATAKPDNQPTKGEPSMSELVAKLMHDNLMAVFNERDDTKRQAATQHTYAPAVRWTDAEGVTTGHAALEAKCVGLQSGLGDLQFEPVGPVHELPGFGYLAWRLVDPSNGREQMSGFDTAVIADGLITELWTVLIPPSA